MIRMGYNHQRLRKIHIPGDICVLRSQTTLRYTLAAIRRVMCSQQSFEKRSKGWRKSAEVESLNVTTEVAGCIVLIRSPKFSYN